MKRGGESLFEDRGGIHSVWLGLELMSRQRMGRAIQEEQCGFRVGRNRQSRGAVKLLLQKSSGQGYISAGSE